MEILDFGIREFGMVNTELMLMIAGNGIIFNFAF
jgi:hypothetical protein